MSASTESPRSSKSQIRMSRRTLLAAGGALAVALGTDAVTAPKASAAADPFRRGGIGISANSGILGEDAASQAQSFAFMQAIGVTSLRIDIPWRWVEQTRGTMTWDSVDRVVNLAVNARMSVLGVLTTSPAWAALGGSGNQQTRPADPRVWAAFAGAVAARYRGRIQAYELWNEPNSREYFAPDPDPVAYAAMTRAAVPAIRAQDPSALILAGALGPAPQGDGLIPAVDYFRRMLAAGVGAVDAFSYHPYDQQSMADAAVWDNTAIRQVMDMHRILAGYGWGDKKIWASEYGASSLVSGEDAQNSLVVTGMTQWLESDISGPMFIHHHRDRDGSDGFGLSAADLRPKSSAYSVQWMARNGVPVRDEAQAFRSNADAALGAPLGPVFALPDGYAQDCDRGVRFATPVGWLSSPTSVGDLLRRARRVPAGPFANGMQDVLIPEAGAGGGRAFVSAAGTFLVVGAILSAWTPDLGFPTSDQRAEQNRTVQDFAQGSISWSPTGSVTVVRR